MKKKLVIFIHYLYYSRRVFYYGILKTKRKRRTILESTRGTVEKYIYYNIEDVKSITFIEKGVSPMGVPKLKGYINNNKELDFIASISTTKNFENKFTRSGIR